MTTSPILEGTSDVPAQVFEKFLQALRNASASAELVARLRKTLLEDKKFTERALKEAILVEEPLP
jgi:tripartite-type tricarboxylate transporter receptor subunit TctC